MINVMPGLGLAIKIVSRPDEDAHILYVARGSDDSRNPILSPHAPRMMIFECPSDAAHMRRRLTTDTKLLGRLLGIGKTVISATVSIHLLRVTAVQEESDLNAEVVDLAMTDEELQECRKVITSKLSPLELAVARKGL